MKTNQIELLNELFNKMNAYFFDSALPIPIITLVRFKGARGYFLNNSFKQKDENNDYIHEISLNPEYMDKYDDKTIGSEFLHEMVHLWQFEYGKPSKNNYHNKEFHEKMLKFGLQTYDVRSKRPVGYNVSHRIIENGKYSLFYDENVDQELTYIYSDPIEEKRDRKETTRKVKYQCPNCEKTVCWGKPDMKLVCGLCQNELEVRK